MAMGDKISPGYPRARDSEYLAQWALQSSGISDAQVDALDWSGNSGETDGATLTFRVHVDVEAHDADSIGQLSTTAGSATRCWQLTVYGWRNYDTLERREINCPPDAAAKTPAPAPLPAFPSDVETLLTAAVTGAASIDIDDRVRAAFPDDFYSIVSGTDGHDLVVALGIPSELECAVGVQAADGSVKISFGKIVPGEGLCTPDLYFHPVITH